jgi:hypothetical protein
MRGLFAALSNNGQIDELARPKSDFYIASVIQVAGIVAVR